MVLKDGISFKIWFFVQCFKKGRLSKNLIFLSNSFFARFSKTLRYCYLLKMAKEHLVLQTTVACLGASLMSASSPNEFPSLRVITSVNHSFFLSSIYSIKVWMSDDERFRAVLKFILLKIPLNSWWWWFLKKHGPLASGSSSSFFSLLIDLLMKFSIWASVTSESFSFISFANYNFFGSKISFSQFKFSWYLAYFSLQNLILGFGMLMPTLPLMIT